MKMAFIFFFIVCDFSTARAEEAAISLSDAVSQAESRNPELSRLDAETEKASWAKTEALSAYIPHLSAGYDHYFAAKYLQEGIVFNGQPIVFPGAYPQDNLTIDASWTFFDGLEGWHRYQAASLIYESSYIELLRAKFKVVRDVRTAFFRALADQKLVEVARQNIKTLQDHLDKAHITEKAGYGTRFDVLRIEATLEEARADLEQAEAKLQESRGVLNEIMGLEKESIAPLVGELPVLTEGDVPKDLAMTPETRDDLQAQIRRTEAAREMRAASHGYWLPSVSLFAEEEYYKFGSFSPVIEANGSYQNAAAFGLRLKWNLFDGGASYARQREALAASDASAAETRKMLTKMPHEFETWKRNFFSSVAVYKARARALVQYEESVRLAVIGVRAGSRTHTEMLDAELDLFRARAGLVKAQAEAIEALGKLELAVGHQIWKGG